MGKQKSKLKPNDMNLLDHYVTKVIGKPYMKRYANKLWWCLQVEYACYGHTWTVELIFNTEEEAKQVKVGYVFQA